MLISALRSSLHKVSFHSEHGSIVKSWELVKFALSFKLFRSLLATNILSNVSLGIVGSMICMIIENFGFDTVSLSGLGEQRDSDCNCGRINQLSDLFRDIYAESEAKGLSIDMRKPQVRLVALFVSSAVSLAFSSKSRGFLLQVACSSVRSASRPSPR